MAFDAEHPQPMVTSEAPPPRPAAKPQLNLGVGRRSDLDWLRVIAFGLLILFHVGLVYAPFDWHLHSRYTAPWLREGVLVTGPWRLSLLFFISGAALRLMSRKHTAGEVVKARLARLVPPFLFGVAFLVPPQAFLESVDKGLWHAGPIAWWTHEFSPEGFAAGVPLNHLWFVLYILAYSLLATALVALPKLEGRLSALLGRALSGPVVLIAPIVYLVAARLSLFPTFGISNHLSSDWYNHASSFAVFLLGFLVVGQPAFWRAAIQWRWASLGGAALSLPILMAWAATQSTAPEPWWAGVAFAVDQWACVAAILGFGALHLQNRDGPALRYLAQAVFPCYLAHQTILVFAVWLVRPLNLPAFVEPPVLIAMTIGGCLALYEVVRRINLLRPLWGLKRLPRRVIEAAPVLRPTATGRTEAPALTAEAA